MGSMPSISYQTLKALYDEFPDAVTFVTKEKKITYFNKKALKDFPFLTIGILCKALDNDTNHFHDCKHCPILKTDVVQNSFIRKLNATISFVSTKMLVDDDEGYLLRVRIIDKITSESIHEITARIANATSTVLNDYLEVELNTLNYHRITFNQVFEVKYPNVGTYKDILSRIPYDIDENDQERLSRILSVDNLEEKYRNNEPFDYEFKIKNQNQYLRFHVTFTHDDENRYACFVSEDITDSVLKNKDSLTYALNRTAGEHAINELIKDKPQNEFQFFMFDIDDFKDINDSHGHLTGDAILKNVSQVLLKYKKPYDLFTRLGGDEFGIIYKGMLSNEEINFAHIQFTNQVNELLVKNGINVNVSFSIGHALYPEDGINFLELYRKADQMMYRSKKHKKAK